jgi:hypothetical protein
MCHNHSKKKKRLARQGFRGEGRRRASESGRQQVEQGDPGVHERAVHLLAACLGGVDALLEPAHPAHGRLPLLLLLLRAARGVVERHGPPPPEQVGHQPHRAAGGVGRRGRRGAGRRLGGGGRHAGEGRGRGGGHGARGGREGVGVVASGRRAEEARRDASRADRRCARSAAARRAPSRLRSAACVSERTCLSATSESRKLPWRSARRRRSSSSRSSVAQRCPCRRRSASRACGWWSRSASPARTRPARPAPSATHAGPVRAGASAHASSARADSCSAAASGCSRTGRLLLDRARAYDSFLVRAQPSRNDGATDFGDASVVSVRRNPTAIACVGLSALLFSLRLLCFGLDGCGGGERGRPRGVL